MTCTTGIQLPLNVFIYLFLAVLGLRFCARALSSCGKWGPLFTAVRGPLTIAASLVARHRLQTRRLSSCGSRAQSLRGTWDLPRPGLEPMSPALAGRFSTTAPPGKPSTPFTLDSKAHGLSTSSLCFSLPCALGRTLEKMECRCWVPVVFNWRQESATPRDVIQSFILLTGLQINRKRRIFPSCYLSLPVQVRLYPETRKFI